MYDRIQKSVKNNSQLPASNISARPSVFVQPQTEETPALETPTENLQQDNINFAHIPLYSPNHKLSARPRVQMKLRTDKFQDPNPQIQLHQTAATQNLVQRHDEESNAKTGATITPEKTDQERFADIEKVLNTIPTGKDALALMNKYKVKVEFKSGGGSYFSSASNSMVIDTKHAPERAALTFVHEMNHAKYHHQKLGANVKGDSRDDYVKKMVQEEAEGVIKSIEAKMELEGTTIDTSKLSYPLEKKYKEAYQTAVDTAKGTKLSEAELKKLGKEAGKQRVIKGFMDGEVKTSNTKEPYPDYYGKYWDKINAKTS